MAQQGTKGNKHKYQGRNNGPARQRYWASGKLREHKIKALMRHNGMTRAAATILWLDTRKGRMKSGSSTSAHSAVATFTVKQPA